jgi:TolB protein
MNNKALAKLQNGSRAERDNVGAIATTTRRANEMSKKQGGCALKKPFLAIFALFLMLVAPSAYAELELHISKTSDDGIPIYIANIPAGIPGGHSGIIEADLKRSGRFTIIDRSKIPDIAPLGGTLNAGAYQDIADYVVRGKDDGNGGLAIELVSTSDNAKTDYKITANSNTRRPAHKAADLIYEKVTREKGAFDTRLAYVTVINSTSSNRIFKLLVSDSDGHGEQEILSSRQPILSPSWSPDGTKLAYVSFEHGSSGIYVQNIFSGEKKLISARDGSNSSPAWSPDGSQLAMSLSFSGNAEIYVININNGTMKQVTKSSAIDTEPVWNGTNSIIFTSNRGGKPQLYRKSVSGGSAQRLTFGGKYNSAADVASKKMTFITGNRGAFHVAIKSLGGGSGKDMLSNGRMDETPTLAPNGAMVAYTTLRGGQNTLAVVSDNGKARQFLRAAVGDIRYPAWSPYLHR